MFGFPNPECHRIQWFKPRSVCNQSCTSCTILCQPLMNIPQRCSPRTTSDPLDFDTWLCLSLLPPFFQPFPHHPSPSLLRLYDIRHLLLHRYPKYQHFILCSCLNTRSDDPPNTIQRSRKLCCYFNKHAWCLSPWLLDVYNGSIPFLLPFYLSFSVSPLLYKPRYFYNKNNEVFPLLFAF
jgi:hypothetical protein